MDAFFAYVENSALSTWIREASTVFAFQFILVLHALGMGLLAGGNASLDLQILRAQRPFAPDAFERWFPVLWGSFALSALSGVLLLIAYPTKALTNPLFYVKLACVALAMWVMQVIRRTVLKESPSRAKFLAAVSLLLWMSVIGAGRLLAYTYTRLLVHFSHPGM
jgi:hypothetical protein